MKIILLLIVILSVLSGFSSSLAAVNQSSPAEFNFQSLSNRVKQIETRDAYQMSSAELTQKIIVLKKDLEAYIDANDTHIDALLLSVRLSYIEEVFTKDNKNQQPVNPAEKFLHQHERLDKVLKLDPDNAKASYWKARLYGVKVSAVDSQGEISKQPADLEKAIHFAKQAVQLDPTNTWYREALAVYYITANNRQAALQALDTELTAYNPVNILLQDLEAFPLPEGSAYLNKDSESYGELQLNQKIISDFPQLRSQVFVVPMSASDLEKFFQQAWPDFKFFNQGRKGMYAQFLIFDPDLKPTLNMAEARSWVQQQKGGIILSVMDVSNPEPAQRQKSPQGQQLPAELGDEFSYVFFVNNRAVE